MNERVIRRITLSELGQIAGRHIASDTMVAFAGAEDGIVRAAWGLDWAADGRCWIWFGMLLEDRTYPRIVLREAAKLRRLAMQMGETRLFCWRDEHPHSAKLLNVIGMRYEGMEPITFADGAVAPREVWVWEL